MTKHSEKSYKTGTYIPALDGLRGLAILLVFTYHYFGYYAIFSFGWTGVDLFFVLSGFLITRRLLENKDAPNRYSKFYRNRSLRIMPLYYLVLIIFFTTIFFLVKSENASRFNYYKENWYYFVFFIQNWLFISKGIPIEQHLRHFWSLAIEEQFYLIWPLIVYHFYFKKHFKHILWLSIVIIVALRFYIYYNYPGFYRFYTNNTLCRADSLIMGAMVYFIGKIKSINYIFFASLIVLIAGITINHSASNTSPFFGTVGYTTLAIVYACLVYYIVKKPTMLTNLVFNSGILKHLGKISYGLYIFHWPVLLALNTKLLTWLQHKAYLTTQINSVIAISSCILVSYFLSIISYYYYESYFLKLKTRTAA